MPVPAIIAGLARGVSALGRGAVSSASRLRGLISRGLSKLQSPKFSAHIQVNHRQLSRKLKKASDDKVEAVMQYALKEVKPLTPKDTGKARRGWHLEGKGTNTQLVNKVEYIGYLENGHSKQAPSGMMKPLKRKIRGKFK